MLALLLILFRGLMIGILVSAPMGPIGMLCIQRTLNRGRRVGMFTGIGAALSDVTYCLLTGLGLSFVTDFIEDNQSALQIAGSVFLVIYAVYLYRSNPTAVLRSSSTPIAHSNPYKDLITGFLFTFSNPLILFFIIGLFARFNFLAPEFQAYHYVVGYAAIAGGAVLWWSMITYAVDRMRTHFNLRSLKLVNRIIGSILFVMALFGIITALI